MEGESWGKKVDVSNCHVDGGLNFSIESRLIEGLLIQIGFTETLDERNNLLEIVEGKIQEKSLFLFMIKELRMPLSVVVTVSEIHQKIGHEVKRRGNRGKVKAKVNYGEGVLSLP